MTSCVETIDFRVTVHDEFVVLCDLLDGSKELLSLHSIIIMSKTTEYSTLGWHFNLEGSHLASIIIQANISVYGVVVYYPISRNAIYSHGVLENHFHRGLFSISVSRSAESSITTMNLKSSAATYGCGLDVQTDISDASAERQVYHIFFQVNVTWPVLRLTIN